MLRHQSKQAIANCASPPQIRVLLTGPDIRGFSGGIQTFVDLLLQAFRSHPSVLIVLLPVTLGLYDRESWLAKILRNLRVLPRFFRQLGACDLVHVNSTFDNRSVLRDVAYLLLAHLRGKPVLLQFHGGDPRQVRLFRWPVLSRLIVPLLCRCRFVLVLSKLQSDRLRQVLPSLERVRQVANFIPLDEPVAPRNCNAARPVRFLFLARVHVDKGIREILQASRQLAREGCSFHVDICGDGPERFWVEQQLADADLSKCVHYRGVVRGGEKVRVLQEADVMLLPSRHEAFPFTLLEAMAFGLPLIASPVGAIAEVLQHDVTGMLVPGGDAAALAQAMRKVIADRDSIGRMSRAARALAEERYSLKSMHEVFSGLYGDAVMCPVDPSTEQLRSFVP